MTIREFQQRIEHLYFERDRQRGLAETFIWFVEEVGELARALHRRDAAQLQEEFADVLAWLSTLASLTHVDLEAAARKYLHGCPKCHTQPCQCPGVSRPEEIG